MVLMAGVISDPYPFFEQRPTFIDRMIIASLFCMGIRFYDVGERAVNMRQPFHRTCLTEHQAPAIHFWCVEYAESSCLERVTPSKDSTSVALVSSASGRSDAFRCNAMYSLEIYDREKDVLKRGSYWPREVQLIAGVACFSPTRK